MGFKYTIRHHFVGKSTWARRKLGASQVSLSVRRKSIFHIFFMIENLTPLVLRILPYSSPKSLVREVRVLLISPLISSVAILQFGQFVYRLSQGRYEYLA